MAADFTDLKLCYRCLSVDFMKKFGKDMSKNTSVLFFNEISYGKIILMCIYMMICQKRNIINVHFSHPEVGNFCFNLLLPFLLIICILSLQAILFQILLYALFPRFPWLALLSFPSYFKLHNLTYLGVDVLTNDMTTPLQMTLNYHIFNLHNNTHSIPQNFSRHPIDQSHPTHPDHTMLQPMQPCLIFNSRQGSTITIKSLYMITYVGQNFGIHEVLILKFHLKKIHAFTLRICLKKYAI